MELSLLTHLDRRCSPCSYLFLQDTTLSSSFSLDGDVEAQSEEGGPTKTQGQCWHKSPMPKPVLWCLKKVLANGAQMPVLAGKLVFQIPSNPFFLCFFLFLASATSSSHDLMTFLGLFCHVHLEGIQCLTLPPSLYPPAGTIDIDGQAIAPCSTRLEGVWVCSPYAYTGEWVSNESLSVSRPELEHRKPVVWGCS